MQPRRFERVAPLAGLAVVTDASAAQFDFTTLTSSPLGSAWVLFAIAITVVIVLLLWYAVDDERPEQHGPQRRRDRETRARSERARNRRTA